MVTFEEITSKTLRVNYKKDDIEGYLVKGAVTYNLEDKPTEFNGAVYSLTKVTYTDEAGKEQTKNAETHIGTFRSAPSKNEKTCLNVECEIDKIDEVNAIAKATLADLANGYTE